MNCGSEGYSRTWTDNNMKSNIISRISIVTLLQSVQNLCELITFWERSSILLAYV